MGFLYLAMGVVMGGLVVLPRLLLGTPMLGANLLDERWRPAVVERSVDFRDDVGRDLVDGNRDELVDHSDFSVSRRATESRGREPQTPDRGASREACDWIERTAMKAGLGRGASVKFWRWIGSAIAALVAAGCFWFAAAGTPARGAAPGGEALQVGGPQAGKPGESARAPERAATGSPADAGAAAREVLQGDDFWWKRTERVTMTVTVPKTGILGFFARMGDLFVRLFRPLWDGFVEFLKWLYEMWRTLYGWLATGDWTSGSSVIWLIAAVILGWAIWKLSPFVVRWISGLVGTSGAQPEASVSWQKLPEPADLFTQARRRAYDPAVCGRDQAGPAGLDCATGKAGADSI